MKKIFLLITLGLFAFTPSILSQSISSDIVFPDEAEGSMKPPYTPDDSGIAYRKQISKPMTDGTYWIKLEAFLTGSEIKKKVSTPADIVLVLDVSGSMETTQQGNNPYISTGSKTWTADTDPNFGEGKYTRVTNNGTRRNLRIQGNYIQQYTNNGWQNWQSLPYTGAFDIKKIDALKDAVKDFIKVIDENDRVDPDTELPRAQRLGNRISIVAFSGASTAGSSNHTNSIKLNTGWKTLGNNRSVTDYTGYNELIDNVEDDLTTGGGTHVEYGMQDALALINNSEAEIKTVVLFTDGIPGTGTWGQNETTNSANGAINYSNSIKGSDGKNATVWSVGLFNLSGTNKTNADNYMSRVSSNYLGVTNMNSTATPVSDKYYIEVDDSNALGGIFTQIASSSGGSNKDLGESTVTTVDVVSTSFKLPNGDDASASDILVYTAECYGSEDVTYEDEDGNTKTGNFLKFRTEVLRPNSTDTYDKVRKNPDGTLTVIERDVDVDNYITVGLTNSKGSSKKDSIYVNGFDFSNNWCGVSEDQTGETPVQRYRGHKLILMIPIKMDESAVGGPGVSTNGPGSGLFVDGESQIDFKSPKVNLPVNIHIQKQDLRPGESAKFTIYRSTTPNDDSSWTPVTSVFLTKKEGQTTEPYTKLLGLPATDSSNNSYVYKVVEDDWSWSYTSQNITYREDGKTVTNRTDELVTNPFKFKNTLKTGIDTSVRHAESKATNTIRGSSGDVDPEYIDSKNNGRSTNNN